MIGYGSGDSNSVLCIAAPSAGASVGLEFSLFKMNGAGKLMPGARFVLGACLRYGCSLIVALGTNPRLNSTPVPLPQCFQTMPNGLSFQVVRITCTVFDHSH